MEMQRRIKKEKEDEEEEEEEGLLPDEQMRELEKQNNIIWLLYKEAEDEGKQKLLQHNNRMEMEAMVNPLTLSPSTYTLPLYTCS